MKRKNNYKQFVPYVVLIVIIAVILLVFGLGNNQSHEITYNELLQYLSENKVTEITTSERKSDGVLYITGKLSDYQRVIVEMKYGTPPAKARTLEQIGDIFSITRERVRQIEDKALKRLKKNIKYKVKAKDYVK